MKRLWLVILVPAAVLSLSSCENAESAPVKPGWVNIGGPGTGVDVYKAVDRDNGATIYVLTGGKAMFVLPKEKP